MKDALSFIFHKDKIRVFLNANKNPLFVLPDVCKILQLQNPSHQVAQIKEEFGCPTLNVGHLKDVLGRDQQATLITESQLYFVMMRSRSPIAREFRQWICNDILPTLRKTGSYTVPKQKQERREPEFVTLTRDTFSGLAGKDRLRCIVGKCVWFCLDDVANALGIGRLAPIFKQLEPGELRYFSFGEEQNLLFGNDLNFLRLSYYLRTIAATEYQRWIFREVFPKLQKILSQYTFLYNDKYTAGYTAPLTDIVIAQEPTPQVTSSSPTPSLLVLNKNIDKVNKDEETNKKRFDEDLLYIVENIQHKPYKCGALTAMLLSDPKNDYEKDAKEKLKKAINIQPLQIRTEFMKGYAETFKDLHDKRPE